jgi:hypothetical protein
MIFTVAYFGANKHDAVFYLIAENDLLKNIQLITNALKHFERIFLGALIRQIHG